MADSAPRSDDARWHSETPLSEEAVRHLGEAITRLGGDSEYLVRALTEMLLTLPPVSGNRLTDDQKQSLLDSGAFVPEELAAMSKDVDRGALQLGAAKVWLSGFRATMPLEDVANLLHWSEEAVLTAASEGRLYAVEIAGRLRFPEWQFDFEQPGILIPGLAEIIELVAPRWDWRSTAAFMTTPQTSLVAEWRTTPVAWLRGGGDITAVRAIVEADDWR